MPEKPVEINGPDAVPFLDKVLARKVSTMQEGRGYYAIACTPQGGIFMDGVIFKLGPNRFWFVQADGPFETWLWPIAVDLTSLFLTQSPGCSKFRALPQSIL